MSQDAPIVRQKSFMLVFNASASRPQKAEEAPSKAGVISFGYGIDEKRKIELREKITEQAKRFGYLGGS